MNTVSLISIVLVTKISILIYYIFYRDNSIRPNVERIFTIWEQRGVFDATFIEELQSLLGKFNM